MLSNTLVSPPPPTPPTRHTSISLGTYSLKKMELCNHMCIELAEAAESFITMTDVTIVSFSFVCVFARGLQYDKGV